MIDRMKWNPDSPMFWHRSPWHRALVVFLVALFYGAWYLLAVVSYQS